MDQKDAMCAVNHAASISEIQALARREYQLLRTSFYLFALLRI